MTIKATGVPSYTSFYADVDGQLFEQPIQHNGKYKFVLKDDGPFATGLMPQFMRDQNSNSYDIYINIPNNTSDLTENIATLQITDGVLDSVLQLENGILNLPSSIPALNTATHFNTNGKDYATGVSIDLTNLTYYSSMPEIDNGNYGNVIPVNENNVEITLLDDNNDKTDVEHTITPYNPNPNKRSIKAINLTKDGNMRDVTAKDIVGYIRVNIPPPTISSTISTNGYYKFNTNWNGLIEGTEQDYELDIQVPNTTETLTATQNNHIYTPTEGTIGFSSVNVQVQPLLQSKTITIDSIESNQSTVIEKTGDYISLIPAMSSNVYNGGEIEVSGTLGTDTYKLFDGNTSNNIGTSNQTVDIKFDHLVTVNKIWIQVGDGGSWTTSNKYRLYGCNDDQYTDLVILYESDHVGSYTKLEQVINENNQRFKYYRIIINNGSGRGSVTREIRLYTFSSTFDGINTVTIVNNTDSKIYKGYNNNNKYSITQTGDGTITIPTDYQALGEIKYNVNVPPVEVETGYIITGLYVGSTYYPFSSLSHSTSGYSGTNWCGVSISGDTYTLATIGNSHSKSLSGNVYYYSGKSSTVGIGDETSMVFSVSLSWDDEGFGTFTNSVQPTPTTSSVTINKIIYGYNSSSNDVDITNISGWEYHSSTEDRSFSTNYLLIQIQKDSTDNTYNVSSTLTSGNATVRIHENSWLFIKYLQEPFGIYRVKLYNDNKMMLFTTGTRISQELINFNGISWMTFN